MFEFLVITYLVTVAFSAFVRGMCLTKERDVKTQVKEAVIVSIIPVLNVVSAAIDLGIMFNKEAK